MAALTVRTAVAEEAVGNIQAKAGGILELVQNALQQSSSFVLSSLQQNSSSLLVSQQATSKQVENVVREFASRHVALDEELQLVSSRTEALETVVFADSVSSGDFVCPGCGCEVTSSRCYACLWYSDSARSERKAASYLEALAIALD